MAAPTETNPYVAAVGHVYTAEPGTDLTGSILSKFKFTGGDADLPGWDWIGDASSENLPEFSTDGGDTSSLRSWDRQLLRAINEPKTHSIKFSALATTQNAIEVAFPNSTWDETNQAWKIDLDSTVEKAVVIVVEDGNQVCAHLFPKTMLSGSLPSMDLENFAEIEINGTILDPGNGKPKYAFFPPRAVQATTSTSGS